MANKKSKSHSKVSPGTKIAGEMRAIANNLSDKQREEAMSFAMQFLNYV